MSAKVPYPVDEDAADAPGLAAVSKRHGWRVRQRMENWPAVVRARSEGYDDDPETVEANVRIAERRLAQARVEAASALDWAASIVREGLSDDELTLIPSVDLIRRGVFEMDLEVLARAIRNASTRGEPLEEIRRRFGDRGFRDSKWLVHQQEVGVEALRRLRPWLEANEARRVVAELDRKMIAEQRASEIAKAREWEEEETDGAEEDEGADGEGAREGAAGDGRTGAEGETPATSKRNGEVAYLDSEVVLRAEDYGRTIEKRERIAEEIAGDHARSDRKAAEAAAAE